MDTLRSPEQKRLNRSSVYHAVWIVISEWPKESWIRWGSRSPMRRGSFGGKGVVAHCKVQGLLAVSYESVCHLSCGIGWAEGTVCSLRVHSYSPGGANVPDDTLPWAVQKWMNRSIYPPICPHERAHWRHLANMIELFVCSIDVVLCQITLTTCLNLVLLYILFASLLGFPH